MPNNITVTRSPHNPILKPNPELLWEAAATFNPSVLVENDQYYMVYRALSAQQNYEGQILNLSTIGLSTSKDGVEFNSSSHQQLVVPSEIFDHYGCEDPRLTKIDNDYFICYTALSNWPPNSESIKVAVVVGDDLKNIKEKHLVTPFNAKAMALFPEKINGQYVAILTINTDQPPSHVAIAKFDHKEQIWDPSFWHNWYLHLEDHILFLPRLNTDHVEVGAVPVKTSEGWVLIYSHIQNYLRTEKRIFGIEAVLLDLDNPQKIIGRTEEPLLLPTQKYELEGMINNVIFPSGATINNDEFQIYYGTADTVGAQASVKLNVFISLLKNSETKEVIKFHKFRGNPILTPREDQSWQAQAVFNSAAVFENNQFYLLFRAMSWDNTSTIGCAISQDGFNFTQPTHNPVYMPRMPFENKSQPNTISGCEDPRLTKIDDRIYMFYTAFDGQHPPQVALTSIQDSDFIAHNWLWEEPILISNPQIDNKNACLFPGKINDKFVILHRTAGHEIAIDYINQLSDLNEEYILEKEAAIGPRPNLWDSSKIGIAGPPIKTEKGWLLIYHGVSNLDQNYRLGYMILDLDDPFNILYRSRYPILEPQMEFEKKGIVDNVVFSCGAVEKDGLVYLYYGGADKVMCVATMEMKKLIEFI